MLGLGCMRLSTSRERDDGRAVAVIRAALDSGLTLLDTSDAYCLDDRDAGHNERLVARALAEWVAAGGDRSAITVATKGGMRRPKGAWVADGRARHLRDACDASRRALGVETIDLYQLHAPDPKTPFSTSVRALAKLQADGWVRDVGLCNVTVGQIREAQEIVRVACVQVSLSPLDDESLRNGVAEHCRDHAIRLIAHRPLGGERRKSLAKDVVLRTVADRHRATAEETALAWLLSFGAGVVPIPGATRLESISSIARARAIRLTEEDRQALDAHFPGTLLRVPRAQRRPPDDAPGDVVIVMGIPAAGKSTVAEELHEQGYERLNRDTFGGSLADLLPRLETSLATGRNRVVLDNTYPTRASRNEVIETAWSRGVPVRCIWLTTTIGDAQRNAIGRMLAIHGSLATPEHIKERSREDTRFFLPEAQFRYERALEPPTADEGFVAIEERPFSHAEPVLNRALILDFDDLATEPSPRLREVLDGYRSGQWLIFVHAWRPQIARGEMTDSDMQQRFAEVRASLGPMRFGLCPHDAGPPACWCRKPIAGSVLEFAFKCDVSLMSSIVVGSSPADRTMAERIGATHQRSLT